MYALDSNSVVLFFKGRGRVAENLRLKPRREIAIPAIVLYELEVGAIQSTAPEKRRAQLDELTSWVRLLPFGPAEALLAAQVRARLEKAGTPIGPYDTLIAATALRHRAVLVTHNVREFQRVAGLLVEDWF
jgi:tRNA(fMet)-specific endonuclease VapC